MADQKGISIAPRTDFKVVRIAAPLRQSVVESIRSAIGTGRFAPGDRLPERELCEMIGVSRTLVREALRQLESEGLINVLPNRGPIVARLNLEQTRQLYEVRCELEGLLAAEFARNASDDDRRDLKNTLKRLKDTTLNNPDAVARVAAKNDFYACMLRGSGNQIVGEVLGLLNSRVVLLRATSLLHKGRAARSIAELTTLVKALIEGDEKAAREAARVHVQGAAEAALNVLRARDAEAQAQPVPVPRKAGSLRAANVA